MNLEKKPREPLFSIHTTDSGAVALYLEEQDAVKDLVQDIVGAYELDDLDLLRHSADRSIKAEGYFEHLDNARDNLGENAPLLALMTEDEALNLAQDIITAIKLHRINKEARITYPELRVIK